MYTYAYVYVTDIHTYARPTNVYRLYIYAL